MYRLKLESRIITFISSLIVTCSVYQTVGAQELGSGHGVQRGGSSGMPAWEWTFDQMAATVGTITPGRDLTPKQWPGGARVAVLFSLDVDNESEFLSFLPGLPESANDINHFSLSDYQYGARRGIKRLTDIFDAHEVPATYFIPAVSMRLAPEMAEIISRSGRHEVALHGIVHEPASALSPERQRAAFEESIGVIESATGTRPVGYRAPAGVMTEHTIPIMKEQGLLYSSNLLADDRPFELNLYGKPTGMIELPPSLNMSDLALSLLVNPFSQAIAPREVLEIYKDGFDTAWEEGGMWVFVGHPHLTGRRSRAVIIKELIEYMKDRGDVWFATHKDVAEYVKSGLQN